MSTHTLTKKNEDEIQFMCFLFRLVNPAIFVEIGIDHGKHITHAPINTKCIGIDKDNKIVYPITPYTRIIKSSAIQTLKTGQLKAKLGAEKIDLLIINKYKSIKEINIVLKNITSLLNSHSAVLIKVGMEDINKLQTINNKNEHSFYIKELKYLVLSKYSEEEFVNKLSKQKKETNVQSFGGYRTIKKKTAKKLKLYRKIFKKNPRCLAVLLCYNDGDILEQNINYLLQNKHDIIVWDHSSNDTTSKILDKYQDKLVERRLISREFDFYHMYQSMSKNIIDNYYNEYDFVSWPDQDEILEGPDRKQPYYDYIKNVYNSKYSWILFNNFVFWMSPKDDISIPDPIRRLKGYCLYSSCSPRIRAFKMESINIRFFNHNHPYGLKYPKNFNLKHYPMRTKEQLKRRLEHDRISIARSNMHFHYRYMKENLKNYYIPEHQLHFDNDAAELDRTPLFDWHIIYGARKLLIPATKNKLS